MKFVYINHDKMLFSRMDNYKDVSDDIDLMLLSLDDSEYYSIVLIGMGYKDGDIC